MNDLFCIFNTGSNDKNRKTIKKLFELYATQQGSYTSWGIPALGRTKTFIVEQAEDPEDPVFIFRKPCWSSGGVPDTMYRVPQRAVRTYLDNLTRRLTTLHHLSDSEYMSEADLIYSLGNLPSDLNLISFFTEISEGGVKVRGKYSRWGRSIHVGKFVFMEKLCGVTSSGEPLELQHTQVSLNKLIRDLRLSYNAPRFESHLSFHTKA